MGLFGLAAFATEQRRKEIGIRKVLGASVTSLTGMVSREFIVLVLVAMVIASPLAYYFMEEWLSDFAYRIDMQWWIFALAGVLAYWGGVFDSGFSERESGVGESGGEFKE